MVEGITYRLRTGIAWRDLPAAFGPHQTLTAGQAGDSPMLEVLADLAVARPTGGRPRTRTDTLLGDKAYSSAGNREPLRRKRVKAVIPQPNDQEPRPATRNV